MDGCYRADGTGVGEAGEGVGRKWQNCRWMQEHMESSSL